MASASSFSTEDARLSISEKGVYYMKDAAVGERVAEFEKRGYPTKTEYGLDFCAQNTLDHQDIRTVVESILDRPRWGLLKMYSSKLPPDLAFFFHNRTTTQMPTLLVQLWSPESRVVFYKGSHLENLDAQESDWGLLALPREKMRRGGITETEVKMAEGGLAIMDSRLGFTILEGYGINIGFVTQDEVQMWAKMELPDLDALRRKVVEMERKGIGTNFKFVKKLDVS